MMVKRQAPRSSMSEKDRKTSLSLEEVHRTVKILKTHWWQRLLSFAGPAYLVAVGYMDPGNWATDLEGGAAFGYRLIWVLLMSNVMALLLQTLSARLGLVTGRDLAQACHDDYPPFVRYVLFVLCEFAICACDLAEVLGSAIALNLLFGIPLLWAVVITAIDVLFLLAIQRLGIRKLEAFILTLIITIGICFLIEIFLCKPSLSGVAAGFIPRMLSGHELYVAIAIIGATVMPHNLYLHSALVQSRDVSRSQAGVAEACRFNLIDSSIAMNGAFLINGAILVVAAATFHRHGVVVTEIPQAATLLDNLLGSRVAPIAFAVALLCAGQSSTITGTLAGQITMEGFLRFRIRPWVRRLTTRLFAIVPAVWVIWQSGASGHETESETLYKLLILSQVVLSLQLAFAVVPLIKFTGSRQKMGPFVNPLWVKVSAWTVAAVIILLNGKLVIEQIQRWIGSAGQYGWLVGTVTVPLATGLAILLVWMTVKKEELVPEGPTVSSSDVADEAARIRKRFGRIGVALEAKPTDSIMLAEAIGLAKLHDAELVLIHVVEGAGGQWYGSQTGVQESREDESYLSTLAERLRKEHPEIRRVDSFLGYGKPSNEIVRIAREQKIDFLVLGGHGHRGFLNWFFGQTIPGVRQELPIPVLTIRR